MLRGNPYRASEIAAVARKHRRLARLAGDCARDNAGGKPGLPTSVQRSTLKPLAGV